MHFFVRSRELMRNAISLAYEYNSSTVFYSDIQRGSINAVHFNGSRHRVLLSRECPRPLPAVSPPPRPRCPRPAL